MMFSFCLSPGIFVLENIIRDELTPVSYTF